MNRTTDNPSQGQPERPENAHGANADGAPANGIRTMLSLPRRRRAQELVTAMKSARRRFKLHMRARDALAQAQAEAKRTLPAFLEFARAAKEYRDDRLWEEEYSDFGDFVRRCLGVTRAWVYEAISLLRVVEQMAQDAPTGLAQLGMVPTRRQLKALSRVPPEKRGQVVAEAAAEGSVAPSRLDHAWASIREDEGNAEREDEAQPAKKERSPGVLQAFRRHFKIAHRLLETMVNENFTGANWCVEPMNAVAAAAVNITGPLNPEPPAAELTAAPVVLIPEPIDGPRPALRAA